MAKTSTQRGPGRPKSIENKVKTSLFLHPDTMRDIRLMAAMGGKSITDLINDAMSYYKQKWEKDFGPVPKPPKK